MSLLRIAILGANSLNELFTQRVAFTLDGITPGKKERYIPIVAIEVVIFHLQPAVTRANFLAAVDETTALLKTQDGFISRTVSSAESGEWLDILTWESIEAAKAAAAVFQTDPAGKRFSDYLDLQQIQVFFTESVVEVTGRA